METEVRDKMRGGQGQVHIRHLFKKEEIKARTRLCARLTLPPGATFDVASDGTVLINGKAGGKISLFSLPDASQIRHAGSGLISYTGDAEEDAASSIVQGSLEGSNVDPVAIMVEMMALLRGMEANQKAITAQDGSLGRLIQWAAG